METRKIGRLDATIVGIGCNNFGRRLDADAAAKVVNAALEAGVTFFDSADVYGSGQSEEYLGRALGKRRNQAVIATKYSKPMEGQGQGAGPAYIRKAVEASLRRLGTDHIDLYQQHDPDPSVPIEETLGALNELVKAGKALEIACSNFSSAQIREADDAAKRKHTARFVSVQNEYSLFVRDPEKDVLPECERLGLAFLPYYPLASGLLTGKYRKGQPAPQGTRITNATNSKWLTDENLTVVEALVKFAEAHNHTLLELAFGWLLAHRPVASVIAGAMNPVQVKANAASAGWRLSPADLTEIDKLMAQAATNSVAK